ncbi:hypothetical protein L6164_023285 [Bauhinia variegata]|uniref:Uncharacterized protein n=1 Tax=Bauhinia variegata TaxID=167791 RepID=A0ACB9MIN8_BAUVA|nr:hypothetical protein L6164_023285 [Bauhinia variegata]
MYTGLKSRLVRTQPQYEDFQPVTETKENPESNLLLIHLPGFKRDEIAVKYYPANRKINAFGERRFNLAYPLPENCDASRLQRRFEGETLTIIMPKKVVSKVPPEEEPTRTQQAGAATPPPAVAAEAMPPTPVVEGPKATAEAQKDHGSASREAETTIDKQKQQPAIAQPMLEKTQVVIPPNSAPPVEVPKSTREVQKPQTAAEKQEQDEKKPDPIIPKRDTSDSIPQKEEIQKRATGTTVDNVEKQRVEERKEKCHEKTPESGKPPEKEKSSVVGSSDQKESNGEREESGLVAAAESSALRKVTEEEKGKEEKINGKVDAVAGGKGKKNGIEPKGKGIQEKLRDEDKQMLMYVSAGVAIIVAAAIGVYAAYKFRSLL